MPYRAAQVIQYLSNCLLMANEKRSRDAHSWCHPIICSYIQNMHTTGPIMTTKPSEVRFWSEEGLEKIKERGSLDLRFERGSIEKISRSELVTILESASR